MNVAATTTRVEHLEGTELQKSRSYSLAASRRAIAQPGNRNADGNTLSLTGIAVTRISLGLLSYHQYS
jgi:hypothetical protein